MPSFKTRAIVIGRFNLGESDRLLTLFSPEFGKIRAIAKGARKTKSKFGGHTELFSLTDFIISKGKSLDIISDAVLVKNYFSTEPDIERVKTVYFFAEVLNKLMPDEQQNMEIYELLVWCLTNIQTIEPELTRLIFVARVLKNFGIYPELTKCVKCENKPDEEEIYFSKGSGGILDKSCSLHFSDSNKVEKNVIKFWRYLTDCDLKDVLKVNAKKETVLTADTIAMSYLSCATMIDYRSVRVLS